MGMKCKSVDGDTTGWERKDGPSEKRTHLWFFQTSIHSWLQVAQIAEHALLKLLHVLDRPAKRLEPKDKRTHDIRSGDMVQPTPEHARDVLGIRE